MFFNFCKFIDSSFFNASHIKVQKNENRIRKLNQGNALTMPEAVPGCTPRVKFTNSNSFFKPQKETKKTGFKRSFSFALFN